ncbi:tRNA (adenine(22)-N(1))-methyltransferase TrmK [Shewanella inventionis]|uniref:SAM-dependent methyltransferase n=1 Tax=Shewanella inventionis TaxID=1738770 RepID=A0ABQ1JWW9_9GAMM|nr:tRNA (adenine(22)-N(1))-methyltransferase TrmK [Shewanella inventionis]MCL1160164.1 tRNA (adenine(22)-N(1))-methyltransferase TrmK [Shewanella inventionis]UAL45149.1 tRNA (adenine(22)-N(1))-methyltransferase TrmK [Shewanella inventionis]GGB77680.1 SAM-dependent methyltransferase [Shewanella inventionis]
MKLGLRLTQLNDMIPTGYLHIWDCCCDHGLLGAALLSRQASPTIHFVDIVPNLMQQLEDKLQRFYPRQPIPQWHVHCIDVAKLPLSDYSESPLVVIAGVGGDLMIELVNSICLQNPQLHIDFLLCPVHHQYELRQHLIKLECRLIDEKLIEENRRFYEILYIRRDPKLPVNVANDSLTDIDPIGNVIWQASDAAQQDIAMRYLAKTIAHYSRINQSRSGNTSQALKEYQQVHIALK